MRHERFQQDCARDHGVLIGWSRFDESHSEGGDCAVVRRLFKRSRRDYPPVIETVVPLGSGHVIVIESRYMGSGTGRAKYRTVIRWNGERSPFKTHYHRDDADAATFHLGMRELLADRAHLLVHVADAPPPLGVGL